MSDMSDARHPEYLVGDTVFWVDDDKRTPQVVRIRKGEFQRWNGNHHIVVRDAGFEFMVFADRVFTNYSTPNKSFEPTHSMQFSVEVDGREIAYSMPFDPKEVNGMIESQLTAEEFFFTDGHGNPVVLRRKVMEKAIFKWFKARA